MTADIPDFAEATRQMRQFLASRGQPNKLLWVFREDLCRRGRFRVLLRQPPYPENEALSPLAQDHPGQVSATIGFDEGLAHLIEAGADAFLMPSRFEPCGMNQMYSQRYGTPPVVRATGGLADTVVDCTAATLADGSASGFVFQEPGAAALLAAIERAVRAWRDGTTWRALQRNGMAKDFGWEASARRYAAIYARLANKP